METSTGIDQAHLMHPEDLSRRGDYRELRFENMMMELYSPVDSTFPVGLDSSVLCCVVCSRTEVSSFGRILLQTYPSAPSSRTELTYWYVVVFVYFHEPFQQLG